jgi:hypothetical protein
MYLLVEKEKMDASLQLVSEESHGTVNKMDRTQAALEAADRR